MIPELGHFALILGLTMALAQAYFCLVGAATNRQNLMVLGRPAAAGQFVFVALSFVCLAWAFVNHDFSVAYVAQNSNSGLPTIYRIAAVWGAHEGSMLLWVLVLTGWTLAVAASSRALPEVFAARVLGVLGLVSVGFILFTLLTSNPFERLIPPAFDGRDLNPLLQDPAMAIHPPILYMGYVGFSVAFAFGVAALIGGQLDPSWARWTRRWTTLAWMFLTTGIALGSWWAYYELGWGGWWFWDPVENASFMPWLVGTALIHSLAVTEKRGAFVSWTLLLSICAFALSLLGTFLVRSGVLVSVHAFASDPQRGLFILVFLAIVIGGSLLLYAVRAPRMISMVGFKPFSRETFLLFNNVFLVIAAALILLGTLAPLITDYLWNWKISVGPPYFELVFLVPMLPLVVLLGVGPHVPWKKGRPKRLLRQLAPVGITAVVVGLLITLFVYGGGTALTIVGAMAAFWILLSALYEPWRRWRQRGSLKGMPRAVVGMTVAHLGVGLFVLGVTVTKSFGIEEDLRLDPGEQVDVSGYSFMFRDVTRFEGPNYSAIQGEFLVAKDNKPVAVLWPQKRVYRVQQNPMTEAAIDGKLTRDLFVALGEPLDRGAWSARIQYKPLLRFVWLGALFMAFGGLIVATDRRYHTAKARQPEMESGVETV
ncbi:MAG: heme lyase CcmF/NrfE family subunit [Gammaproteobacteria bacterium]